jgi:hypothetical protein
MNQRTTGILLAVTFAGLGAADSGGPGGLPVPVAETGNRTLFNQPAACAASLAPAQALNPLRAHQQRRHR